MFQKRTAPDLTCDLVPRLLGYTVTRLHIRIFRPVLPSPCNTFTSSFKARSCVHLPDTTLGVLMELNPSETIHWVTQSRGQSFHFFGSRCYHIHASPELPQSQSLLNQFRDPCTHR